MGSQAAQQLAQARNANLAARQLIQARGVEMIQQIAAVSGAAVAAGVPLNIQPRNVGLIKGFWVQVTATLTNANATPTAATPTDFGIANMLSQVVFTDLNNNIRIQTSGWHLAFLNSLIARRPYGAAIQTLNQPASGVAAYDTPIGYGSVFAVDQCPASIAGNGGTGTVTKWYWVPLAYSNNDYRGAVYANVVNATMQLSLTVNPTTSLAAGNDNTLAMFGGPTTAQLTYSGLTVNVWQVYMDQIPQGPGGPVLPVMDLSTIYELKNTVVNSLVVNTDFPIQYSNFRDYLSTVAVYYNGANRLGGTDVSYWALQSANFTNLWKMPPSLLALRTRNHLSTDLPRGVYYFGSRNKPISTTQYGNMELILNASTAGATAYVLLGYEDFAIVNSLTLAGSLPGA